MTDRHGGPPESELDWDDERLNAAFAARAASTPTVPADVGDDVLARLRPARRGIRWAPAAIAAAAAAALLVSVTPILGPPRSTTTPPHAGTSGEPSPAGLPNPVVAAIGDPMTVTAALAVRESDRPDREILVQGFLSPLFALPCPMNLENSNPTLVRCPESFQYLMDQPEPLAARPTGGFELHPPVGPAFHPSFALVEPPMLPAAGETAPAPVRVVLMGHFRDRRAELCPQAERPGCEQTFVVDRVVEVYGVERPVGTTRRTEAVPNDLEADVDALIAGVAPTAVVESRRLVPIGELIPLEPVLTDALVIPYIGNPDTLAWIVTTVDLVDRLPTARTFVLLDGSNWFAEIISAGAQMLERAAPEPTRGAGPFGPTAEPDAFAGAPMSVLGIRVQGVRDVAQGRDLTHTRDEYAVRGWYIAPRPGVTCEPPASPAISAPTPPCDQSRRWLFGDPETYGIEPGQLRRDPNPTPAALNPLLPVDVPFDVAETWRQDVPVPQPVIVLGHFNDWRVSAFHGGSYFVIDALVWNRAASTSIDYVVRLTSAATEDAAAVTARIEALSADHALATWATAVDSSDFAALNPSPAPPEFLAGPPVWIVRRLVADETDGRQRLAVETAYTADRGQRVWLTPSPDSEADLATSFDIHDLDANTTLLQVFDYDQVVVSVQPTRDPSLVWHEVGPVANLVRVARGRSAREVAVQWVGTSCDQSWRIDVHAASDGLIVMEPWRSGVPDECPPSPVKRQILFEFDQPVDLDQIHTGEPCCG